VKINDAGLALIKAHEGLRLKAYQDVVGVWTIGWGHTGDVKSGQVITQHQAEAILDVDLDRFERAVEELTKPIPLTPNEFSALVSLVFNIGIGSNDPKLPGGFTRSTLRRKILARDLKGAAAEFPKWNHAGGRVLAELTKRRAEERALFERAP
jgi:lysozyme